MSSQTLCEGSWQQGLYPRDSSHGVRNDKQSGGDIEAAAPFITVPGFCPSSRSRFAG
jgi:hypothetical protein